MFCRCYNVLHNFPSRVTMSSPEFLMWKWKAKWLMSAEMRGVLFAGECEETLCLFQVHFCSLIFCSSFSADFEDINLCSSALLSALTHVSSCRRESPGTQRSPSCSWRESWCRPGWWRPSLSVPSKRCKTRSWTWRRWASWDMMRCSDFSHQPVLWYDKKLWNGVRWQDPETRNKTASQKENSQACLNLTVSLEKLVTTGWHQRGTSPRGADRGEAEGGRSSDGPEGAEAASQKSGGSLAGQQLFLFLLLWNVTRWLLTVFPLLLASLGTHHWSLERQPQEEHVDWAAGRADEREVSGGRGPGRAARDPPEDAGDGDTGQSSPQRPRHSFIPYGALQFQIFLLFFLLVKRDHTELERHCCISTLRWIYNLSHRVPTKRKRSYWMRV